MTWHGNTQGHREAALKGKRNTGGAMKTPMKKKPEHFIINEDRNGNVTISHSKEIGEAIFQFEQDKESIYELLKPSERKELNGGWDVEIPDNQPRASTLQELFELGDSQRAEMLGISVETLKQAEKEVGSKLEKVEEYFRGGMGTFIFEDGTEYIAFENSEDAEKAAIDQVKEDLRESPENFTQSWLENFISISPTDRRIISGEEADNIVDNMSDEDLIKEADMEEEYEEVGNEILELEDPTGLGKDKYGALTKKQMAILEKAKDKRRSDKQEEIENALTDPIRYFVDDQGIYTKEDLLKQNFIRIDIEKAAQDAVKTDGVAHFLATYSGEEIELSNNRVMYRIN